MALHQATGDSSTVDIECAAVSSPCKKKKSLFLIYSQYLSAHSNFIQSLKSKENPFFNMFTVSLALIQTLTLFKF